MDCSRGSQQLAIGTDIDLPLSVVCEFATGEHALLIEVNRTWRAGAETVEHPFGTINARMGATHFPDEDAATGCRRDGVARTGL
jgi:hypothetical protein